MYGDVLDRLADQRASSRPRRKTSERQDSPTEQPRIKATFYLSREDILAIDRLQSAAFMQTGKKPERSHLVSEAVQLLLKQKKLDSQA